jgi:hypothetical protein
MPIKILQCGALLTAFIVPVATCSAATNGIGSITGTSTPQVVAPSTIAPPPTPAPPSQPFRASVLGGVGPSGFAPNLTSAPPPAVRPRSHF